ncbi:MAG: lipoate--protein ligase family protein [Verrucomicrobiota bacterium]|nr:lipoate--protein ligase family protein [Verrucomicrobiota bacterium]
MIVYDFSFSSPGENLACDEALLDWREETAGPDILRFWQSANPFIVVGYANSISTEVNVANCRAQAIPILRRCSGGGTVLQGPGCLNYALVLNIAAHPNLAGISTANRFIMQQNRAAIQAALRNLSSEIAVRGHTDLAIGDRKFSGNSQRRRKHYLLFHGTFLLHFDLKAVADLLRMPSRQPDYRSSRSHADFLANLNAGAAEIKNALKKIWAADHPLADPPLEKIARLAGEKYGRREWNFKFQ